MKKINHLLLVMLTGGFLFAVDKFLKYLAHTNQNFTYYLWRPWLGWEFFPNAGIAFSLPVPNWLVVVLTPIILGGLVYWFISLLEKKNYNCYLLFAICLIMAGAVSNYIDRVLFGYTIDYFRIFTGVINLADVMIVVGVGLMLLRGVKNKK